jgi:S-(hydroxymethyl)glutathione dehydrogenase / alcohol dehydrogenase
VRAAVLESCPGDLKIDDVRIDAPRRHEVLVRVAHAGLCHSDLHFIEGVWQTAVPVVMGHEAAGIVEAVGDDVTGFAPGDHVIACLSVFCGECRACLSGRPHQCANRDAVLARSTPALTRGAGEAVAQFGSLAAFAEQMLVHQHALVRIRPDMPLGVAALIGCGVTTGLGAVLRTAHVQPSSSVAVVGCGGIGLAAVQGARLSGAWPIVAIDVDDEKLARARALGATHTVNARTDDPVEAVRDLTGGGIDYSFEAIGLKATAEQCFAMLGKGGVATIIGMLPLGTSLEIPGIDLLSEKRLQGCAMGSNRFRVDMPHYCELYLDGRLQLDDMVTAHRPLDEINEGYADLRAGVGLRTLIDF